MEMNWEEPDQFDIKCTYVSIKPGMPLCDVVAQGYLAFLYHLAVEKKCLPAINKTGSSLEFSSTTHVL